MRVSNDSCVVFTANDGGREEKILFAANVVHYARFIDSRDADDGSNMTRNAFRYY